jgi:hypothetical protein
VEFGANIQPCDLGIRARYYARRSSARETLPHERSHNQMNRKKQRLRSLVMSLPTDLQCSIINAFDERRGENGCRMIVLRSHLIWRISLGSAMRQVQSLLVHPSGAAIESSSAILFSQGRRATALSAAAEAQTGLLRNREERAAFCTESLSPAGKTFYGHSHLQLLSNGANSDKKTTACRGDVWIQPTVVTSNGV